MAHYSKKSIIVYVYVEVDIVSKTLQRIRKYCSVAYSETNCGRSYHLVH